MSEFLDVHIDRLNCRITGSSAHSGRVEALTRRAVEVLSERMPGRLRLATSTTIDRLATGPVALSMTELNDDEAAEQIAGAILQALALKLNI